MKKIIYFISTIAALALIATSCDPKEELEQTATITLSDKYADMTGEEGSTATIDVTANFDNITAVPTESTAWLEVAVSDKTITVKSLSVNDGDEERWVNVVVTVTGVTETNTATAQFTARQAINSDAVKIIPDKTKPIISAAACGETSSYTGGDNRYKVEVSLVNATDFSIDWDKSATWLLNVEKAYEEVDGVQNLVGILISAELNDGKESREAKITLSVDGADYATKVITLYQKSNPFGYSIGDYDAVNNGTIVYLDVENYNFYLLWDNIEKKTTFFPTLMTAPSAGTDPTSTANCINSYHELYKDDFDAEHYPALYYCFNRNNTTGTDYAEWADVPSDVITDLTKWHMPSRDEIAYIFKRTIYGYTNPITNNTYAAGFNDLLTAAATANNVEITTIATTGTIYMSSHQATNGKISGYATTNLRADKTNQTNGYSGTETTKSFARCVRRVIVDTNE